MTTDYDFKPRNDLIDVLRAFAILGVFTVHIFEQFEIYWASPTGGVIHDVVTRFIMGKSFSLLALCFGLSFYILMDRAARKGGDFSGRFAWRMIVLAGFGILHGALYRGDVLQILAPAGLLLIPFWRIKNNWVIAAIAAVLCVQPWLFFQMFSALSGADWANQRPNYWGGMSLDVYMHGGLSEVLRANLFEGQEAKWWFFIETGRLNQIIGLFLVGFILGRIGYFTRPEAYGQSRLIALSVLGLLSIGLYFGQAPLLAAVPSSETHLMGRVCLEAILNGWFDLTLMGVYVLGITALYLGAAKPLIAWLVPAGRMTLTLYVMQSLVWVPVFYGFGLGAYATLPQVAALGLGASFFVAQVLFARLWFRHFRYGPLEWLWRAATFLTLKVPFRVLR